MRNLLPEPFNLLLCSTLYYFGPPGAGKEHSPKNLFSIMASSIYQPVICCETKL